MSGKHAAAAHITIFEKLMRQISSRRRPLLFLELAAMAKDGPGLTTSAAAAATATTTVAASSSTAAAAAPKTAAAAAAAAAKTASKASRPRKSKSNSTQKETKQEKESSHVSHSRHHHQNNSRPHHPPDIESNRELPHGQRQRQRPRLPPLFSKSSIKSPLISPSLSLSQTPVAAFSSHQRSHQTKSKDHLQPGLGFASQHPASSNDSTATMPKIQQRPSDHRRVLPQRHESRTRTESKYQSLSSNSPTIRLEASASASASNRPAKPEDMHFLQQLCFREKRPGFHSSNILPQSTPERFSTVSHASRSTMAAASPVVNAQYWTASYPPSFNPAPRWFTAHPTQYPYTSNSQHAPAINPRQSETRFFSYSHTPQNSTHPALHLQAQEFVPFDMPGQAQHMARSWSCPTFVTARNNSFDGMQRNATYPQRTAASQPQSTRHSTIYASSDANYRTTSYFSQPASTEPNGLYPPSQWMMVRQTSLPLHDFTSMSISESYSTLSTGQQLRKATLDRPSAKRSDVQVISKPRESGPIQEIFRHELQYDDKLAHRRLDEERERSKNEQRYKRPGKDAGEKPRPASPQKESFSDTQPDILIAPRPTREYLEQAQHIEPCLRLAVPQPLLVVVDLNGTLILRRRNYSRSLLRPGFWQFLNHIFEHPQRYQIMIWTSARRENVSLWLNQALSPAAQAGILAIWCRDRLGFTQKQYRANTQAYKRLDAVWAEEKIQQGHPRYGFGGRWNQRNTVLLDDSTLKAAAQPHNLIHVPELTQAGLDAEFKYAKHHKYTVLQHVLKYLDELSSHDDVSKYIFRKPIDFGGF